jgi:hypothetical protein
VPRPVVDMRAVSPSLPVTMPSVRAWQPVRRVSPRAGVRVDTEPQPRVDLGCEHPHQASCRHIRPVENRSILDRDSNRLILPGRGGGGGESRLPQVDRWLPHRLEAELRLAQGRIAEAAAAIERSLADAELRVCA